MLLHHHQAIMTSPESSLYPAYKQLKEIPTQVVNILTVIYSGVYQYNDLSLFSKLLDNKKITTSIDSILRDLKKQGIVVLHDYYYVVESSLRNQLFLELMAQPEYVEMAKKIPDLAARNIWDRQTGKQEYIRDFLYGYYLGHGDRFQKAESELIQIRGDIGVYFKALMGDPGYDSLIMQSPAFTAFLIANISAIDAVQFNDLSMIHDFIDRVVAKGFKDDDDLIVVLKAQLLLYQGRTKAAFDLLKKCDSTATSVLRSQVLLFLGEFANSVTLMDETRVKGKGTKNVARKDFGLLYEYFYWLTFLFYPQGLNKQQLQKDISAIEKDKKGDKKAMLPLLNYLNGDLDRATGLLYNFTGDFSLSTKGLHAFWSLLNSYLIFGSIRKTYQDRAIELCERLKMNGYWLFYNEMIFILKQSKVAIPQSLTKQIPELPNPIMSNFKMPELWEKTIEGLLGIVKETESTGNKVEVESRLCYFIDLERCYLQPVVQTRNASGAWSKGKNVALKRLKDNLVSEVTPQDYGVIESIRISNSGYYGKTEYVLNLEQALVALCGHPYLFLLSNPDISVQLIAGKPEIYTEETATGVILKTDVATAEDKVVVIKENQTRYKVISLSPDQQKAIRLINKGVEVPHEGKYKLLKAVSQLSGIMMVQSDIVQEDESAVAVEADPSIRVQILPIGDGLKAEMFVKPLRSEPPYLKPGKGGKVVYGIIDGNKCQTFRDLTTEKANATKLSNALAEVLDDDIMEEAVMFDDPRNCLALLETLNEHSDIAVVEWPEGERFRLTRKVSFNQLSLRVTGKRQWFDLEGELTVDENTVLTLKELLEMNRKGKGRFLELKKNEFLAITEELKKQLDDLEAVATIDKAGIKINPFAIHAIDDLTQQAGAFKADKSWKDLKKKIKDIEKTDVAVPATLDAELRSYQEEGFRWMTRLNVWGGGACLADDMGLGKTLQAIAMLLHLAENGPSLVVCPASVASNWGNELRKFAPTLNVVMLKPGNREETFAALNAYDVLVITYGLLQTEEERIVNVKWAMAVLDEAHAIKNTQTKSAKAAMNITAGFKLALTGTPIQNHLGELWNLFNFCNPGLLGSLQGFTDRFVKDESQGKKVQLKKLISPFILRRTKNKVLDELPPKIEITYSVELSDAEVAFYEALRLQAIELLESGTDERGPQHLQALAEITKLRLACCNSALVDPKVNLPSAKLDAFFEIITELRENKHRALVFSQFVGHLSIVRKALDKQKIPYQYLDGSTPMADRERAVKDFQSGKGDLFLISLKAGGLGLNLTAADYVLHLDPWWNPAIEDQASDRAHRMGQTRPVTIYRLVAKNTIEEKILKLHSLKRDMADSLLEGTDKSARMSTSDLLDLLKER